MEVVKVAKHTMQNKTKGRETMFMTKKGDEEDMEDEDSSGDEGGGEDDEF